MAESYRLPSIGSRDVLTPIEIFAHFTGAEILEGGTIEFPDGVTEFPSGQVLGRITASGKYTAYDDGAADGTAVAVGVLRTHVVQDLDYGEDALGEIVFGQAVLKLDQLTDLDAGAVADLDGKEDSVRNTFSF